jgi:hypothetical protein
LLLKNSFLIYVFYYIYEKWFFVIIYFIKIHLYKLININLNKINNLKNKKNGRSEEWRV